MDFKPFDVPPSDYHALNTGLGGEGGVTPRNLVAGINAYLAHLFAAIEGKAAPELKQAARQSGPDLVKLFAEQSDRIAKLERDVAMLEDLLTSAKSMPHAQIEPPPPQPDDTAPKPLEPPPPPEAEHVDPVDEPDSPQPPNSLAALLAATGGGKAG